MSADPAADIAKITASPSYRVAYKDVDFLARSEMRAARLELEYLKPELNLREYGVRSTIVVFGSTQLIEPSQAQARLSEAERQLATMPGDRQRQRAVVRAKNLLERSRYYEAAREFGRLVSTECQRESGPHDNVIVTGGGPGIMEGANRGAHDVGAKSVGLNIRLPREQQPNPYITPDLCFQFHYFAMRKLHFLLRARALVAFPGGFGTFDELFDALTLRQTGRMQAIPIILFGREYWQQAVNFQFLADNGTIADDDLNLIAYAETAAEAWELIRQRET
jgi:uncharacterized protein (TIGR00730 family)